jgi:hypothetical protein
MFSGAACDMHQSSLTNDPKQRLNDYISRSFSVKGPGDRKALLEYLTGDAKTRLEAWSDDQFQQAFVDSKREFVKLAFKEVKPVSPTEVDITYEITYVAQGAPSADPASKVAPTKKKITNKKLATLVQDQGKWQISGVQNIKELVEFGNEMSLP